MNENMFLMWHNLSTPLATKIVTVWERITVPVLNTYSGEQIEHFNINALLHGGNWGDDIIKEYLKVLDAGVYNDEDIREYDDELHRSVFTSIVTTRTNEAPEL